jgi:hypothetical protein
MRRIPVVGKRKTGIIGHGPHQQLPKRIERRWPVVARPECQRWRTPKTYPRLGPRSRWNYRGTILCDSRARGYTANRCRRLHRLHGMRGRRDRCCRRRVGHGVPQFCLSGEVGTDSLAGNGAHEITNQAAFARSQYSEPLHPVCLAVHREHGGQQLLGRRATGRHDFSQ